MKLIATGIKLALVFLVVFLILTLGIGFITACYFRTVAARHYVIPDTLVQIPYGSSLRNISLILSKAQVIDNTRMFYWYLRLGRNDGEKMQAGFYNFAGDITAQEIADRLLFGKDQSFPIVFKEGQTLVDLADSLENIGLLTKEEFQAAMTSHETLHFIAAPNASMRQKLKNDMGGIEGYLFPDTYFFGEMDTAESIIKKMHTKLLTMIDQEMLMRLKEIGFNFHQLLTLASIIEKETGDENERPLIASVYHNRLRQNMRLQADPTVIYGIKDYDGKIRKADLLAYHPYNTYKIQGLPPGPIAAPGIKAIRAALWPADTKYLYFVSKNDGSHMFCENIACHNQAVRKWQIEYFRSSSTRL